jgi:ubiquinone/menaquinone biosynthesis C-methylase UbiE
MEGRVARWYAKTRKNDMPDFRRQAREYSRHLSPHAEVLEIAPGPGYFTVELAKLGDYRITALDISKTFIEIATQNAREAQVQIDFRLGDVAKMPFADNSFDAIYCAAAFKNFPRPIQSLAEMHRVLRPGGSATILDLRKDVSMDEIKHYVKQSGRSRLDALITSFIFRHTLIKRAYTQQQFEHMARQSPFKTCEISLDTIGMEVHLAKNAEMPVAV